MNRVAEVKQLYKTLLFMGRDYPLGYDYFRTKLHAAFSKKRSLEDPHEIDKAIQHAHYVVKELEALYFLKKYREMKRRYDTSPDNAFLLAEMEERLQKSHHHDPPR